MQQHRVLFQGYVGGYFRFEAAGRGEGRRERCGGGLQALRERPCRGPQPVRISLISAPCCAPLGSCALELDHMPCWVGSSGAMQFAPSQATHVYAQDLCRRKRKSCLGAPRAPSTHEHWELEASPARRSHRIWRASARRDSAPGGADVRGIRQHHLRL